MRFIIWLLLTAYCGVAHLTDEVLGQEDPQLIVLGIAQDGGYPQAGCRRTCCERAWQQPELRRFVSCVAIVDPVTGQRWMLDCTPDFRDQLHLLDQLAPTKSEKLLDGIFLTHAHVGHYAGLIHLGREVLGTKHMPVYCMPRLQYFLESQGPWSQLVSLKQIAIQRINAGVTIQLNDRISVTAIPVPHRDEFSETVAFLVEGPNRSALYLPDIDKWDQWEVNIEDLIKKVDVALLDATFYDARELPGRDMSEIPHPFIVESIERFSALSSDARSKIHFIHLNHSNPALEPQSDASRSIQSAGMHVAGQAEVHQL